MQTIEKIDSENHIIIKKTINGQTFTRSFDKKNIDVVFNNNKEEVSIRDNKNIEKEIDAFVKEEV